MPTYQYKCETCGIVFERKQHFTDEPLKRCPECEGRVRRVIHPVEIVFKGPGFYVTDNRKASSSTLAPSRSSETKQGGEGEKKKDDSIKTASDPGDRSSED